MHWLTCSISSLHTCADTLIRALNSIILQAPNVKDPTDVSDFVTFAMVTMDAIVEHHTTEETLLFPLLEKHSKPGLMDENVVQHEEFHYGMHELGIYLRQVQHGVRDYDGQKVVKLMDGFTLPLTKHLEDEITTLLALEAYDVPSGKIMERAEAHAKKTADPVRGRS